jgi:ABC-type multidrug transport system fused ATPase/permease subunit
MDEATSSVDLATERILLQVVKDVFKDSTVLTIAVSGAYLKNIILPNATGIFVFQ